MKKLKPIVTITVALVTCCLLISRSSYGDTGIPAAKPDGTAPAITVIKSEPVTITTENTPTTAITADSPKVVPITAPTLKTAPAKREDATTGGTGGMIFRLKSGVDAIMVHVDDPTSWIKSQHSTLAQECEIDKTKLTIDTDKIMIMVSDEHGAPVIMSQTMNKWTIKPLAMITAAEHEKHSVWAIVTGATASKTVSSLKM